MLNSTATQLAEQQNPLLDALIEINPPADITWWPQTLGWQLILMGFAIYLLYRLTLLVRRYHNNAYRRAAIAELTKLSGQQADLALIPKILRRTALYAFERNEVSPLVGEQWEQWLDKQYKKTPVAARFNDQFKGLLGQLAYLPEPKCSEKQISDLTAQVIFWVKNHRGKYD